MQTIIYLLISILMSVSASSGNIEVLYNRAPFLVVEVCHAEIEGRLDDPRGIYFGHDQNDGFIAFDQPGCAPGQEYVTFFLYNPENNYEDDIAERFDIQIK